MGSNLFNDAPYKYHLHQSLRINFLVRERFWRGKACDLLHNLLADPVDGVIGKLVEFVVEFTHGIADSAIPKTKGQHIIC